MDPTTVDQSRGRYAASQPQDTKVQEVKRNVRQCTLLSKIDLQTASETWLRHVTFAARSSRLLSTLLLLYLKGGFLMAELFLPDFLIFISHEKGKNTTVQPVLVRKNRIVFENLEF